MGDSEKLVKYVFNMHNNDEQFEFDPVKAKSNLKKHGVSFAHAEQGLRDEYGLTMDDPNAQGEQRFLTLGMDALGRVLVVCHTQRDERRRLISARKASPNEARNDHA